MSRTKKVASLAFTGAATAATFGLQPGPALAAAGTWHIQAPKGTPYHGAFKIKGNGAGLVMVDANHPSFPITCTSTTAVGSIPHSTVTGTTTTTAIGKIKTGTFNDCSFTGVTYTATVTANLRATSYNSTTQIAKGKLTNVDLDWMGSGNSCHVTMTGTLSASYHNTKHDLVVDKAHKATLTMHSPTAGCLVFGNGDLAYFAGTYGVNTPKSLFVSGPA